MPGAGVALSKILVPVIACGLLLGADALDRGEPLRMHFAVAAFAAPAGPLAAIIVAELFTFAAEWIAAYTFGGVDLLATGEDAATVSPFLLMEILGAGMLVSLPLLFVPFAALFEHASFAAAFKKSWRGFVVNQGPLLIYGLVSLVLVGLGLMTLGIGLVIAIPLISVASYAAWKDIFGASQNPAATSRNRRIWKSSNSPSAGIVTPNGDAPAAVLSAPRPQALRYHRQRRR